MGTAERPTPGEAGDVYRVAPALRWPTIRDRIFGRIDPLHEGEHKRSAP